MMNGRRSAHAGEKYTQRLILRSALSAAYSQSQAVAWQAAGIGLCLVDRFRVEGVRKSAPKTLESNNFQQRESVRRALPPQNQQQNILPNPNNNNNNNNTTHSQHSTHTTQPTPPRLPLLLLPSPSLPPGRATPPNNQAPSHPSPSSQPHTPHTTHPSPQMKARHLESALSSVADFAQPKWALEQYRTPPRLAAAVLKCIDGDDELLDGARVLDLGCGTGMLLAGACLLGAEEAGCLGVDADADALRQAGGNLGELGLEPELLLGDVVAGLPVRGRGRGGGFDVAIMNPPFGTKNQGVDLLFVKRGLEVRLGGWLWLWLFGGAGERAGWGSCGGVGNTTRPH
jgi:predicted RNA methylase